MIKVLGVDDSAVVRQVLSELIAKEPGLELIGTASDPIFAMKMMQTQWPDVIVLDIEMPRMDGLTFLKQIMQQRPTPVIICSSLAKEGAHATIEALANGAVSIITKPSLGLKSFLEDRSTGLIGAIREAAHARVKRLSSPPVSQSVPPSSNTSPILPDRTKLSPDVVLAPPTPGAMHTTTERFIAIGTSTGGTQALDMLLRQMPATSPGIVIVQHMPEKFTEAFAERLNSISGMDVREARNGDRVLPGLALIAPGGKHMLVHRNGAQYQIEVIDGPLVSRHKPSVDVLFRSVAKSAGRNAVGVILTGMGDDGAKGLKEMYDAGAYTIAQDEKSCVVFGMPKEAIKLGAAKMITGLESIPRIMLSQGKSTV
ncbi:chemotaxis response regulator protein-glutamate methylesterase [Burkholderiaceae bacterium DAT-1]|nr:chemotaxis response regulator protein-glutamate methylesterase [Burkholderiaceae bacterium DAT-1]